MIPWEIAGLFFTASLALALAPGPDNIFVLTQSALHGRVAGLFITLGLCSGLLVHTAAVALGVAVIFQTSALAFNLPDFRATLQVAAAVSCSADLLITNHQNQYQGIRIPVQSPAVLVDGGQL